MKKWNEIKNEPITWGGYAKLCGWSTVIYVLLYGIMVAAINIWYYADEISEWLGDTFDKLKSKFRRK